MKRLLCLLLLLPTLALADAVDSFTWNPLLKQFQAVTHANGTKPIPAFTEWTTVPYSSGNFTTDAGTWTVSSANQTTYQYMIIGKTMFLDVALDLTSVSTGVNQLRVAIPGGKTAQIKTANVTLLYDNSNTSAVTAQWFVVANQAYVTVQEINSSSNFAASTSNTFLRLNISFPIN